MGLYRVFLPSFVVVVVVVVVGGARSGVDKTNETR